MTRAALACGHDVTADAVEAILREGGSAADAVIAGALAAMVAEPVLAGLLGGGFCMLTEGRETQLLDFFVQTPRHQISDPDLREVHADFGTVRQNFHIGAGSIATPGIVPGLFELHARAGRLPISVLAEPAIAAARTGVEVTDFQARLGEIVAPILSATPSAEALFCSEGATLPAGARYRNPDLADVLEVLTTEGPRFVTEGEIAAGLCQSAADGGHLTAEDLKRYRPIWRQALVHRRQGVDISLTPPPALGGALIGLTLSLLGDAPRPVEIAEALAATSEARVASGDRTDRLLDPALADRLRGDLATRKPSRRGTTHISVIDGEGRGAALTLSNGEGAGMVIPGTGIMPNNMLGEADLIPGAARGDWLSWPTDTRLASMMCPIACRWPDGRLAMLGSGGSNRIRSALAQVLLQLIDGETDLDRAVATPRLHVEDPDALDFELTGLDEQDRL
ncbi:MAG: gamma-glutamyltransferase, partial [Pseudomonadota bacterium]